MSSVKQSISSIVLALLVLIFLIACSEQTENTDKVNIKDSQRVKISDYVGSQECSSCHLEQSELWHDSHHDLAMQIANEQTVLGDFNNTSFDYFGTTSKFYKKNNQHYVQTNGPDGQLTEYPIAYVFGVAPLQQYLIKFPKGQYQVLAFAWDTRSMAEGGQRWFHLYPDEHIKYDDELHWTGINQNWNFMCADCHSTNLQKNYDLKTQTYNTTWSQIDVGCEACHGPGAKHVRWTENKSDEIKNKGFNLEFNERDNVIWALDAISGNAERSEPNTSNKEIEVCAQCHSRRLTVKPGARPEHALLDNFQVSLLTDPLYHADGQINGEVYVYGSFLQSKMYHAGVTCSDCHEPHSLKLRAKDNNVCAQCHTPTKYDTSEHHLHELDSDGAKCVSCHMPEKNYMVVDPRRDHSFRIPRPDLTVKLGVPNACTQCHGDKTAQWATQELAKKYPEPLKKHFAEAIQAGRYGLPGAEQLLTQLIVDEEQPAIARATAVTLLPEFVTQQSAPVLQLAANDKEPLVGLGLAYSLGSIPARGRLPFAYPLLYDDMRTTRSLAARSLSGSDLQSLPEEAENKFNQALDEYTSAQLFNADRPESLINLASTYAQQGEFKKAEQFYQNAISLAPYYTPAHVNLADHYRSLNDDISGETVLRNALVQVRDKTAIHHALGLLLVRQKRHAEGIEYLRLSAESSSATDVYVYVYAIALHSTGKPKQAIKILEQAQKLYPTNSNIISALAAFKNELGME